jgi:hypothetical protein
MHDPQDRVVEPIVKGDVAGLEFSTAKRLSSNEAALPYQENCENWKLPPKLNELPPADDPFPSHEEPAA